VAESGSGRRLPPRLPAPAWPVAPRYQHGATGRDMHAHENQPKF